MKITIKKLLVFGMLSIMLQGCTSNTDKTGSENTDIVSSSKEMKDKAFIQKLTDLQQRSPVYDAHQAIKQGDRRFFAKAGRGLNIPAVSAPTYAQVKANCGLRYENGFGDVLYGANHRKYYSAFTNYAKLYNLAILRAGKE